MKQPKACDSPVKEPHLRLFSLGLVNKVTLQFKDAVMESHYLSFVEPIRKLQIRSALLLASLLYLLVSALDLYIMPEQSLQLALTIHLSQSILFALFGLYLFRSASLKLHSALAVSAVVIAWNSHLILAVSEGVSLIFAEAYLMLIWIWLVSGISLSQSAKLNLLFLCLLEALLLVVNPHDLATTLSHQYFVFVSLLLGSLGAYLAEYY
ncbi:MAG TPA: hypothetical protein VKA23_00370, partial [Mariprofundaceae bacterium]|nr:hypothetical protein [Mariprofundaceae bacterium]